MSFGLKKDHKTTFVSSKIASQSRGDLIRYDDSIHRSRTFHNLRTEYIVDPACARCTMIVFSSAIKGDKMKVYRVQQSSMHVLKGASKVTIVLVD